MSLLDTYKGKKVFITGHTGFKGAWLTLWLHSLGAEIVGYALEPNTNPNLFDILKLSNKITHIVGDIRDYDKLANTIKKHKPDIVFHMAAQALVLPSYTDPRYTYETNVMGTVNLLEAIRHSGSVKVCVNITSDKSYENKEWVYAYRENDPMGGYDPYSSSKGCAELVSSAYRQSFLDKEKIAMATVRAGNVIGGGDWSESRIIPDCIRSLTDKKSILIRNPDAIRPWQLVLEPLSGYLALGAMMWQNPEKYNEGYNFGPFNTGAVPVLQIVEKALSVWGSGEYHIEQNLNKPHEAHYLKLDCSKAMSELSWHPVYDIDETISETISWYKKYYNKEDIVNTSLAQIEKYTSSAKAKKIKWASDGSTAK